MKPPTITFADIQTSELLYYDPDIAKDCFQFCTGRAIDCLPSLINPLKYYEKTGDGFSEEDVIVDRRVESGDFIFNPYLADKFRKHSLLFVYSNGDLSGVVHFSDYNTSEVSQFLYTLLVSYEKSLRKLLVLSGLKNQDMLDFFNQVAETTKKAETTKIYRKKVEDFEKNRLQNDLLPTFEKFYLKDLMELAKNHKIIKVDQQINNLRNDVMHAHDLVVMHDANRDDYIYDFASFERFFNLVTTLLQDYKRVKNRIAFYELSRRKSD